MFRAAASQEGDPTADLVVLDEGYVIDDPAKLRAQEISILNLEPGDTVTRWLAGTVPMNLKITEVTDDLIICGAWQFDRRTGAEIDEDLGWGEKDADGIIFTGSFITLPREI